MRIFSLLIGLGALVASCTPQKATPSEAPQSTATAITAAADSSIPDKQFPQKVSTPPASNATTPPKNDAGPPLLWRVSTPAGDSYLFGTMHLGVDAKKDIHPTVWNMLSNSKHVAIEIISSELTFAQTQELLFLPGDFSLQKELTPRQWSVLLEHIDGFPPKQLERLSPLMAGFLITAKWLPMGPAVDQVIETRARQSQQTLTGLETFEDTKAFALDSAHVKYLAMMLDDIERAKRELHEMHQAYLQGDAKALEALVFSRDMIKRYPVLYERLFYARNAAWQPTIRKLIERGNAFIAVGAGHLVGPKSVITLLEKSGYDIQRVAIGQ